MKRLIIAFLFVIVSTSASAQYENPYRQPKTKGYAGYAEAGGRVGIGYKGVNSTLIHLVNGYRFNPYLTAGIGTGVDFHYEVWGDHEADIKEVSVPLYLSLKAYLNKKNTTPFFSLDAGYNFTTEKHGYVNGIFLNPSVGASWLLRSDNRVRMNFWAGYSMQQVEVTPAASDKHRRMTHAITFGLGFGF